MVTRCSDRNGEIEEMITPPPGVRGTSKSNNYFLLQLI